MYFLLNEATYESVNKADYFSVTDKLFYSSSFHEDETREASYYCTIPKHTASPLLTTAPHS